MLKYRNEKQDKMNKPCLFVRGCYLCNCTSCENFKWQNIFRLEALNNTEFRSALSENSSETAYNSSEIAYSCSALNSWRIV